MVKCKYEGTGIWNGRCTGTKEVDPCPGYDNCKQYKPNYTTNADRIRAMSDKELAELMRSMMDCDSCGNMFSFKCDGSYEHCSSVCLNWLQQPAEEEDDYEF